MRAILPALLTAIGFAQQPALHMDLSGEWSQCPGDDVQYAKPDYDGRGCNPATLPWTREPQSGTFWLRRSIDLPVWTDRTQLALTLGPVRQSYDVYIIGHKVASTGPLRLEDALIARPRTFFISHVAADGLAYGIEDAVWIWCLADASILIVAALTWPRNSAGPSPLHRHAAFAAIVLLVSLNRNRAGSWLLPRSFLAGDHHISVSGLLITLLLIALSILMVLRLIADRREKERLATEFAAARAVQQLLIDPPPISTEYRVEAVYEPAKEVGGDFYWTRAESDGTLVVIVGDISGKGLQAAMLVSLVIAALRRERAQSPAEILTALNQVLAGRTGGGFVTACCIRMEPGGRMAAANAGHQAPYSGGRELAVHAGLPLGVAADAMYEEMELHLPPGESLTVVSDRVPEASNAAGNLFGFERTREISHRSAREIADAARRLGQNDDITVLEVARAAA